jgi:hypothetical protein
VWERIYWYKKTAIRRMTIFVKRLFLSEILVLGDSQASVFWHKPFNKTFQGYFFNVVPVGGATVSGLDNPNSKTQALAEYTSMILDSKAKNIVVFLGEVDTGFVIWYRAEKYQSSVTEMADLALMNYQKLLKGLKDRFHLICISTPLPTIKDGSPHGEVANLRKSIKASQLQRTNLTRMFNKKIEENCSQNDIAYIMLDGESLGDDGLVREDILNKDPADHHYDKDK